MNKTKCMLTLINATFCSQTVNEIKDWLFILEGHKKGEHTKETQLGNGIKDWTHFRGTAKKVSKPSQNP